MGDIESLGHANDAGLPMLEVFSVEPFLDLADYHALVREIERRADALARVVRVLYLAPSRLALYLALLDSADPAAEPRLAGIPVRPLPDIPHGRVIALLSPAAGPDRIRPSFL